MNTEANIQTLALADIVFRDDLQVRRKLDESAVSRYMAVYKSEAEMPPIRVARIKDSGHLVLIDGWHRVEALRSLGIGQVEAEILDATIQDARWEAACANLRHGVPLKGREIRNVFRAYIRARKHYDGRGRLKSYRTIAADLGGTRNHTTIRVWMKSDYPRIAEKMGGVDAPGGEGGLQAPEFLDPEEEMAEVGLRAAEQAAAAARGIRDPQQRGRLVAGLERALKVAREAGPWTPECDDF